MASIPTLEPAVEMDDLQWQQAVNIVSDKAYRKFAEAYHSRLAAGTALALDRGAVKLDVDNIGHVKAGKTGWYTINGICNCGDVTKGQAPEGWCKHKFATNIVRMVLEQPCDSLFMNPEEFFEAETTHATPTTDEQEAIRHIPKKYIHWMHGKPHVLYSGLLDMAHTAGLISLKADLVSVASGLALATATATFADGRTFTEAADATPENVGHPKIALHFPRMALTRAKARCLRDALNIGIVSKEEVEGGQA